MKKLIFFSFILFLLSCGSDETAKVNPQQSKNTNLIKYAKGFTIEQHEGYKLLTVKDAWLGEKKTYQYVLYKDKKPESYQNAIFVKIPIKSIACMSLTHVAFIERLNQENSIVALSGCAYVSSKKIGKRIKEKQIKEFGQEQNINYEILLEQTPDIIMGFGIDASSNAYMNKMQSLGLKVVLNAEYMENHPLGKAEWIKFVAAFYDKDEEANVIFDAIENSYIDLLNLTKNVQNKPTVFTGMPWKGAWHVPGSKSFQAQLFKDAGASYLWAEDNESTSSLVKSKEVIIDKALDADYWLNLNAYRSITSIIAYDQKFSTFKAVLDKNLYNNDKRLNVSSGNDYWESGVVNPHIILKDLIKIFHPNLINHKLYYYQRIED